jgi:hypothetical protein
MHFGVHITGAKSREQLTIDLFNVFRLSRGLIGGERD